MRCISVTLRYILATLYSSQHCLWAALRYVWATLRYNWATLRCTFEQQWDTSQAHRTLAASVGAKRQRKQSNRYTRPTYALVHEQHTHSSSACSVPYYGKVLRREGKSWKWLHQASLPMRTIIWCYFAAGVHVAMLEGEEKAHKRRRTILSWISFNISSSLRSALFDILSWGLSSSPCSCSNWSKPSVRRQQ